MPRIFWELIEANHKYFHMKTILTILFILFCANLFAQSESAERIAISQKLSTKEISEEEFSKIAPKWNQFLKKYGEYPELPLDQNGQVRYSYSQSFGTATKEKLFNHTLEWIAINYGIYPANLYSNADEGKIVLNNSFGLDNTYSCFYTAVFSIKNGKMLVELFSIGLQGFFPGHDSGGSWVPDKTVNFTINQFFPVALKNQAEWSRDLDFFKAVNTRFASQIANLWDFLANYEAYSSF